jgi:hypothetical protein
MPIKSIGNKFKKFEWWVQKNNREHKHDAWTYVYCLHTVESKKNSAKSRDYYKRF